MTITAEVRSSEVIKCANCSGPLNAGCEPDSLESPVLAFDSFVRNRHVRVTLKNALRQVFGVRDLEECHFCVHCCLIFSQLYGLFHLLGARRREDALLASKLKEFGGIIGQNFENQADQVEVEVSDADGLVSFRNVSDSMEDDPNLEFNDSEPEGLHQDDSRPASPISDNERSVAPEQQEEPLFGEVFDPDEVSSAILQHVTQNGQRILYKCCACQEGFLNLQNFINHRLSSHPSLSPKDLFKCIVCCDVSLRDTEFREHLFSHCKSAKNKSYPVCHICERRFVSKSLVYEHWQAAHLGMAKAEIKRSKIKPRDYKCSDCGEVLKGQRKYTAHRNAFHSKQARKEQKYEGNDGVNEILDQLENPNGDDQSDYYKGGEANTAAEVSACPNNDAATTSGCSVSPFAPDNEADDDTSSVAADAEASDTNDAADDKADNADAPEDSASEFNPSSSSDSESEDSSSSSSSEEDDYEPPKRKRTRLDTSSTILRKALTKRKGKVGRPSKHKIPYGTSNLLPKNKTKRYKPKPTFHCNDCNSALATATEVGSHKREMHGITLKPYQCHHCPAAFNYASTLGNHMILSHMNERPFSCHHCSASYPLLPSLKVHLKDIHMELLITRFGTRHEKQYSKIYKRIYLCIDCDDRFEDQDSYIEHAKSVHGRVHQCPHCLSLYPNVPRLKEHIETHERSLQCDFCDKEFKDAGTLKRHMNTSHADGRGGANELPEEAIKESYDPQRDRTTRKFHCSECTERFDQLKEVVDHITTTHPERLKCWCPLCEVKALNLTHLKEHLKAAHKLSPCPYCSLLSKKLSHHKKNYHRAEMEEDRALRRTRAPQWKRDRKSTQHSLGERDQRLVAEGKFVYKCADCEQKFALYKIYSEHRVKAHPDQPIHKCHLCLYTPNSHVAFQTHLKCHNESDDWPCGQPHCARRFLRRPLRDKHLSEAHGIKKQPDDFYPLPYSQSIKFISGEMSTRASRAEVPTNYNCVDCGAEFTVITDMGKHRREVHKVPEGEEWACHVCEKILRSWGSLRSHVKRHNDAKEFMCDGCAKCFKTNSDLQQHRRLNHDPIEREKLKEMWRKSRERRRKQVSKAHPDG